MPLPFFNISVLDAEPVTSFCLARTRLAFRSETFLCKVTGFCCIGELIFCNVVDDSRWVCKCSSLELSADESVAKIA